MWSVSLWMRLMFFSTPTFKKRRVRSSLISAPRVDSPSLPPPLPLPPPAPITYPFHLLLTSATIPTSLNTYLTTTHPSLVRLASPRLHKLPKTLQTEYAAWSGGNKFADVLRRVKEVWAEDAASVGFEEDGRRRGGGQGGEELSKVVVFCNKSAKVDLLSAYMREQGVDNVPLTSTSVHRERFTNRHLDGFLRVRAGRPSSFTSASSSSLPTPPHPPTPKVLITTSLLSRGLDFSPSIRHVFIVDEPRNMVDFLHRAGRAGRAGERGRVVVFGKMRGRGSRRGRDIRGRVGRLV
ncbi:hypothetical protein GALMADRAFT_729061 [Galerina marginata CBS 339.88]|uniref:RNA helicase n=1 Tax=Galerina marginata (strain CBS 339.88) TaxID=685588 RepID=A0A067STB3_GALM3|nr:hypothetical protein GALMADRAFT_729061 [Galerina marginata CBS 339.88]